MRRQAILYAAVEVAPAFGAAGTSTRFYARARDATDLARLAEAAFARVGLVVSGVGSAGIVDVSATQPPSVRKALAQLAAGAPYAYDALREHELA